MSLLFSVAKHAVMPSPRGQRAIWRKIKNFYVEKIMRCLSRAATIAIPIAMNLKAYLRSRRKEIDRALDNYLPKTNVKPATLHKAMRYSLFAGGKRLRPILCLAAAEACRGKISNALPLACALECIHTYSLVHDDLPSMDNDDYRRGR